MIGCDQTTHVKVAKTEEVKDEISGDGLDDDFEVADADDDA